MKNFWLIGIVVIAGCLRYFQLKQTLIFTLDEELEALVVKNITTGFHLPAIGVAVAPVGIHLSPIFYLLAAIPFWLGQGNPLAWGITAATVGVLTSALFYLTTNKMLGAKIGTIASLLYSSSFLMVMYDKHFWNVMLMPLLAVLTIFSLDQLVQKKYRYFVLLAICLALGISSHLSSLSLVLLAVFILWKYKISWRHRYSLIAGAILLLSQLPLLIFEFRHNFEQTKALLGFFNGQHSGVVWSRVVDNLLLLPKVLARLIYTFGPHDYAREHTYGVVEIVARDQRIPEMMLLAAIGLLLIFVWRSWRGQSLGLRLHLDLILITIISLVVYGVLFTGSLFEFYLAVLFPSLFVVIASSLVVVIERWQSGRVLVYGLVGIVMLVNILATLTATNSYGLARKQEIIAWVSQQLGSQPYQLHSIGVDHKFEGYRYLFEYYFRPPVKSYADAQLAWLYQTPPAASSSATMVVLTSTEPAYQMRIDQERSIYAPAAIAEQQFGEINVLIVAGSGTNRLSLDR